MDRRKIANRQAPRWAVIVLAVAVAAVMLAAILISGARLTGPGQPAGQPEDSGLLLEYGFALTGARRLNREPMPVSSLLSKNRTLWVGSDLGGLFALEDDSLTKVYDGVIYSLLPERKPAEDGRTILGGYAHFEEEPISQVTGENGGVAVLSRPVYLSDHEEEMGLGLWNGRQWSTLWPEEAVWDLVYDDQDRLYLSTNDGVYLYENGAAQRVGLAGTLCFGLLYNDATRVLLVGTRGGVWRHAEEVWTKVLDLPEQKALDFTRDESGRLHAATTVGLYVSPDGTTWQQVGDNISLRTVIVTPNGLVAGGNGGLYVARDGELVNIGQHPQVRALAWHDGRLYAGTNDGLWLVEE